LKIDLINCVFVFCCRAFTQKKLDDLKSLFVSLASKSHSNDQYVSYPVFQVLTICVFCDPSFITCFVVLLLLGLLIHLRTYFDRN